MDRGIAVVNEAIESARNSVAIVTHGNLMRLILKHFNESIGFAEWGIGKILTFIVLNLEMTKFGRNE
ncbi:MAG: hypothetical protein ACFBSE_14895 [Prochloraceae cyanobacterium]